jgi:hypothetical protein
MPRPVDRLLFVYNADSGTLNAILDSARKLLSADGCPLCSLTHSLAGERAAWTRCRESLGVAVDYVHRDELTPSLRRLVGSSLPSVVARAAGEETLLLGPEAIDACSGSVDELITRLRAAAAERGLEIP